MAIQLEPMFTPVPRFSGGPELEIDVEMGSALEAAGDTDVVNVGLNERK